MRLSRTSTRSPPPREGRQSSAPLSTPTVASTSSFTTAGGAGGDIEGNLRVHLQGAFWVIGLAWPLMKEQQYGRIVTIASGAGLWGVGSGRGDIRSYAYGAAKMGLVGLTRNLAVEGARHGIHANALEPVAHTRMTEGLGPPTSDWLRTHFPPERIAPAVAFLAHEDCPANGEVFTAGGGRMARVLMAQVPGHYDPGLTLESVRDNFDAVCDESDYRALRNTAEELDWYGDIIGERIG